MATHDYIISNASGAAVRADLNNALAAIATNNSSATEPTTTYAYQWWADTGSSPTVMKLRNAANSGWITLFQLDGEWTVVPFENGTAAAPSIYFKDSGTDTGLFSGGTDQVNIATAGTERVEWGTSEVVFNDAGNNYDFRVEGDTNANLLFVDASADAVGIGTSSPSSAFHVDHNSNAEAYTIIENSRNYGFGVGIDFKQPFANAGSSITGGRILSDYESDNNSFLSFSTLQSSTLGERLRITSAGRVGIGTTSPSATLQVSPSSGSANFQVSRGSKGLQINQDSDSADPNINVIGTTALKFLRDGSESMRIDTSGRLLVGTSTSRSWSGISSQFQIENTGSGSIASQSIIANTADTLGGFLLLGKSRGTSLGSHTVVQNNDIIGKITFSGADGSALVQGAAIAAEVDGTPGANDLPTRLSFSVTADGASSPTERFRISSVGYLRAVGTSSTARIIPDVDNVGYLGQSTERWQAVYAVNGTIQTSDRRQKTDITEALLGSDFIKTLKPVSYKWIEGGKEPTGEIDENGDRVFTSIPGQRTHWGFIAQDVKEAVDAAGVDFGGWLLDDKDDPDSQQALRYDQFIAPLTKALQEALAEIDILKSKVAALESA